MAHPPLNPSDSWSGGLMARIVALLKILIFLVAASIHHDLISSILSAKGFDSNLLNVFLTIFASFASGLAYIFYIIFADSYTQIWYLLFLSAIWKITKNNKINLIYSIGLLPVAYAILFDPQLYVANQGIFYTLLYLYVFVDVILLIFISSLLTLGFSVSLSSKSLIEQVKATQESVEKTSNPIWKIILKHKLRILLDEKSRSEEKIKSLQKRLEEGDDITRSTKLRKIGAAYMELGKLEEAHKCFIKSFQLRRSKVALDKILDLQIKFNIGDDDELIDLIVGSHHKKEYFREKYLLYMAERYSKAGDEGRANKFRDKLAYINPSGFDKHKK